MWERRCCCFKVIIVRVCNSDKLKHSFMTSENPVVNLLRLNRSLFIFIWIVHSVWNVCFYFLSSCGYNEYFLYRWDVNVMYMILFCIFNNNTVGCYYYVCLWFYSWWKSLVFHSKSWRYGEVTRWSQEQDDEVK